MSGLRPLALAGLALAVLGAASPRAQQSVARAAGLPIFRDLFEGPELDPTWSVSHAAVASVTVANGALRLTPSQAGAGAMWYQDSEGVLVHRPVSGDFTAVTRVHARASANPTQPPPSDYRLGGLLARSPASAPGARDSVHVALGAGVPATPVCAEDKTTDDSVSDFVLYPIASADGELRLRRRGAAFELAYRPIGGATWAVLRTHVRPDMPATLDVGLMAYSASSPPGITVSFDGFWLTP